MSFTSQVATIPTAAWPLTVGLLCTSPLLFGNLGLSICGPLPIITEKISPSGLSKKDKIRVWALFFKQATPYVVIGTLLTATAHAVAAYTAPTEVIRNLSIASAVSSISVLPYTVAFIMPTNTRLLDLDAQDRLTTQEEAEAVELIMKWDTRHKVRYIGLTVGWATGLAALLALTRYS